MIVGLIWASHAWSKVGPWRCLATVAAILGADVLMGYAIASLLGLKVGRGAA